MPVSPPIPFAGGLVDSRDPAIIDSRNAGELAIATDAEYRPADPAPWKVRGRVQFNSSAEAAGIQGARYAEFDGATTDKIVILAGTKYRIADAGATGSFADLVAGLTGGTLLDSIHIANQHVLVNGADRAYYLNASAAVAKLGMLASATPAISETGGAGGGFTLTSGALMRYWIEERVKSGSTIVRRSGTTVFGTITGDGTTTYKPRITFTQANSDATHWAVFASATNGAFPTGAEIAEAAVSTTFIDDPRTGANPALPSGTTYLVLQVSIAGVTQTVARYGPPPIASTGDLFEESLCLNDTSNPRRLWFSYYREPHAWPALNYFDFDEKEHDEIVAFRSLGDVGLVLLRDSAWRIITLPRPEDAAYTPERFKRQIDGAYGCAGAKGVTLFVYDGRLHAAYVSRAGLVATDGQAWSLIAPDLNWTNAVDLSRLDSAVLVTNPILHRLELSAYRPDGTRRTWFFSYHRDHVKSQGRLKVTGPISRDMLDACVVRLSGVETVFSVASDGRLYRNDSGTSEPVVPGGIQFEVATGVIYTNGAGNASTIRRGLVHHTAGTAAQTAIVRLRQFSEGQDASDSSDTIPLARAEASTAFGQAYAEAIQISVSNSDTLGPFAVNFAVLDAQESDARARRAA